MYSTDSWRLVESQDIDPVSSRHGAPCLMLTFSSCAFQDLQLAVITGNTMASGRTPFIPVITIAFLNNRRLELVAGQSRAKASAIGNHATRLEQEKAKNHVQRACFTRSTNFDIRMPNPPAPCLARNTQLGWAGLGRAGNHSDERLSTSWLAGWLVGWLVGWLAGC